MPRTAKYHNSEFCEKFAQIVEATGSEETAIRRSGIGRETYYGWKRAWKKATQKSRDADRNFFFECIEDAISNRKAKVEQDFIDGFKKNPHMAWRWLQQKFPGEYSQRAADQQMAESATPKAPLPKVIINVYDPDKEPESQGESGRSSN